MKIKKIEKLCKDAKEILRTDVLDDKGKIEKAFLGINNAQYAIGKTFYDFTNDNFLDLFEVSAKSADKWFEEHEETPLDDPDGEIFADVYPEEITAFPLELSINYGGETFSIFRTGMGKDIFVPAAWFGPVDLEDENISFWVRGNVIAIKSGFYLVGIVHIPIIGISPVMQQMLRRICDVADGIERGEK